MFDIGVILNRLDQMEEKVEQHEAMVSLVNKHELKINRQQEEIDQLKKKNAELTEKDNQLIETSSDFMPRSCFEVKATNPSSQSGVYSIDPDGQIGGSNPIQAYCDMTTRKIAIYYFKGYNIEIHYLHSDYFYLS